MSDVLIKNMEMPEGCVECPLLLAYGSRSENKIIHHCMGRLPEDSRFSDDADLTKRPKEACPLVEVKPHGRLIDADKLIRYFDESTESLKGRPSYTNARAVTDSLMLDIYEAPTVLEASE